MIRWLRERARVALSGGATPQFARLKADPIAQDAAKATTTANYPGYAQELHEAQGNLAVAEVRAAEQLTIDPSVSVTDGAKLERFKKSQEELLQSQDTVEALAGENVAADKNLATQVKPRWMLPWYLVLGFGVVVAAALVGVFLGPTIDSYVLHSYWGAVLEADADTFSATLGFYAASGLILLLFGLPLALVIGRRGRLHWSVKLAFIVVDLLVAAGFGVVRLGDGFVWQALAVSIIEFGINLLGTVAIFVVAQVLEDDAKNVEAYRKAKAVARGTARLLAQARKTVAEREARCLALEQQLAPREDGARRADRNADLARATVDATYAVEVSKRLAEEAKNPSEEALTEGIGTHLAVEFAREGRK